MAEHLIFCLASLKIPPKTSVLTDASKKLQVSIGACTHEQIALEGRRGHKTPVTPEAPGPLLCSRVFSAFWVKTSLGENQRLHVLL